MQHARHHVSGRGLLVLVNRHLRALAAAGLARTARRGRFVQYQLDAGAVEALGSDLLALLLR